MCEIPKRIWHSEVSICDWLYYFVNGISIIMSYCFIWFDMKGNRYICLLMKRHTRMWRLASPLHPAWSPPPAMAPSLSLIWDPLIFGYEWWTHSISNILQFISQIIGTMLVILISCQVHFISCFDIHPRSLGNNET